MLAERVEQFIASSADMRELNALLNEAMRRKDIEGLRAARRLYEDMYGGFTFNFELKAPAAAALVHWGKDGLRALFEGARTNPTSKNVSLCAQILAGIASGEGLPIFFLYQFDEIKNIVEAAVSAPGMAEAAQNLLGKLIRFLDEDDVAFHVGSLLQTVSFTPAQGNATAMQLFASVATRWMAVGEAVLDAYELLIEQHPADETHFQAFLTRHPQLLDPMAIEVWPTPDLHGSQKPDFVVRRSDDSYLIVEIEKPAKPIVTNGGQLTAEVTQAEQQVVNYRTFLLNRISEARQHFPKISDPEGLVVIGLERDLNEKQKEVLTNANRHRSRVKIIGFDYLSDRAKTISSNVVRSGIKVRLRTRMI